MSTSKPDFGSPNLSNQVIYQNILDKLLNDEVVSIDQYMVIDRLASDYYKANLSGVKASSYTPRATTAAKTEPTNKEFMQRKKISGCLYEVKDSAGEKLLKVLMNILDDKPLSKDQMKDLWDDGVEKIVASINKFYKEWER